MHRDVMDDVWSGHIDVYVAWNTGRDVGRPGWRTGSNHGHWHRHSYWRAWRTGHIDWWSWRTVDVARNRDVYGWSRHRHINGWSGHRHIHGDRHADGSSRLVDGNADRHRHKVLNWNGCVVGWSGDSDRNADWDVVRHSNGHVNRHAYRDAHCDWHGNPEWYTDGDWYRVGHRDAVWHSDLERHRDGLRNNWSRDRIRHRIRHRIGYRVGHRVGHRVRNRVWHEHLDWNHLRWPGHSVWHRDWMWDRVGHELRHRHLDWVGHRHRHRMWNWHREWHRHGRRDWPRWEYRVW